MKYRLRLLLNFFFRLDAIYNKVMFKTLEDDKCVNLSKNFNDFSVSVTLDSVIGESYRNTELSDLYKQNRQGFLVPLRCGHNGIFNQTELNTYKSYLFNSKLIIT